MNNNNIIVGFLLAVAAYLLYRHFNPAPAANTTAPSSAPSQLSSVPANINIGQIGAQIKGFSDGL